MKCSMSFASYFAIVDASLFGATEVMLCFYVLWQHKWNVRRQWMRIVRALIGATSAAAMYPLANLFSLFLFALVSLTEFRIVGQMIVAQLLLQYIALGYLLGLRLILCFLVYSVPRYKVPLYISGKVKLSDDSKGIPISFIILT